MKYGTCANWKNREDLLNAKAAGAEFVELNFASFADVHASCFVEGCAQLRWEDVSCYAEAYSVPYSS